MNIKLMVVSSHYIYYIGGIIMSNYHKNNLLYVKDITLSVRDIKTSLDFYKDILGFTLLKKEKNMYYLGTENNLLLKLSSNSNALVKEKNNFLYHFAILLPNRRYLGQILHHFLSNEILLTGASSHGVSEAIYLNDPDGNKIEIYSDIKESEWPKEDSTITMYTKTLDAASLLSGRYTVKFKKLPETSIIGHIHLHVANLSNALDFFNNKMGFQNILNYGDSAIFLSDGNYHHHIGLNTWKDLNISNKPEDVIGLESYTINLPQDKQYLLENFKDVIKIADNIYQTKDINNCDIV